MLITDQTPEPQTNLAADTTFHDVQADLQFVAGEVGIVRVQEIPEWFLDSLKAARDASSARAGETHRVASVPVAVVEKWMREGFNVYDKNVTGRDILARLKRDGLDRFITTNKAI